MSLRPAVAAALAAAALLLACEAPAAAQDAAPERPRTVVLAVDGMDWNVTARLLDAGRLPHLDALRDRGGAVALPPSNPAQSPVSWASLTTGWNPGKTGIYDFLSRDLTQDRQPINIDLSFVRQRDQPVLAPLLRAALVGAAGLVGAALGLGAAFGIGTVAPAWRRGGRLQAALSAPAFLFAALAGVVLSWVPREVPTAENMRAGEPFWVTADRAGLRAYAIEAPLSFPADEMQNGCCLSGLGTPDARGTVGSVSWWTDDPAARLETETAGEGFFVEPGAEEFDAVLVGPKDPMRDPEQVARAFGEAEREGYRRDVALDWTRAQRLASETRQRMLGLADRLKTSVRVRLRRGEGATLTTAEGATRELAPGVWTDLVPVSFRMSPVAALPARVRFLLQSAGGPDEPFRLFAAQVQFDPADAPPNVGISSPRGFAAELAAKIGAFDTVGWPELTNPVKDDMLSDREFLDHLHEVLALREARLREVLARDDFDLVFAMFAEPDRVQHALYRHTDPENPRHDPAEAQEFAGEIDRIYEEIDRIVGETVAAVPPGTRVVVVSDHGFAPFRRGVNLNNFLMSKGWQSRTGAGGPRAVQDLGAGGFFSDVDWSRTRAYAMGLGHIYLNLAGRERVGVVPLTEAAAVLASIREDLLALRDSSGERVVREVYLGSDLYHGARADDAPDLVVGFERGYRVSWQTCLGACDPDVIVPNVQRWSGDHCSVDPSLVPGVLFTSFPLAQGIRPKVEDVNATVLALHGLAGPDPDGVSLLPSEQP